MEKHVLGLVTLLHPERCLGGIDRLLSLPRRRRSRQSVDQSNIQLAREGKVTTKREYRKTPRIDTGKERKRLGNRLIHGGELSRVLAEPRFIYTYDEPKPKSKWKAEFRDNWPDEEGNLEQSTIETFRDTIATSILQIRGLWINPTVDTEKWSNPTWVNLVLLPCSAGDQEVDAHLSYYRENDRLMIEWTE